MNASNQPYRNSTMEISDPSQPSPNGDETWTKGEQQPRKFNDVAFGLLFYLHLIGMAACAGMYAPQMFNEMANIAASINNGGGGERDLLDSSNMSGSNGFVTSTLMSWVVGASQQIFGSSSTELPSNRLLQDEEDGANYVESGLNDFDDLLLLLSISALVACIISSLALTVMIRHARGMIVFALVFNILASLVFTIGAFFVSPFAAIMGILMVAFNAYFAYVVWERIPFAACNLKTATSAVKANLGLSFVAYSSLISMFCWTAFWLVSAVPTLYITSGCDAQAGACDKEANGLVVFALLVSYYWTYQVIQNTVHVTVAGVVGTWWFVPTEASSFCSRAIGDSYFRSLTYSFGSICLGSLIVAAVESLVTMVRNLRESGDGGSVFLCIAECLLALLRDIIEYFNKWAFTYVGVYGYSFIEAGKNVTNLFKSRGWTTIITDSLAQNVLTLVSVGVGLITAITCLIFSYTHGMVFGNELGASAAAFFIGFTTGLVLTNTLLSLVSAAVNTVIVCYADAPSEFRVNHPKLSDDMHEGWAKAWPDQF
eukprot:scaffold2929_cov145-Skeletonema_menzelii.AAC.1